MASSRKIIQHRNSVANIRKITRTMEMISTSRFGKAHNRLLGSQPYYEKISELIGALCAGTGQLDHPLMKKNQDSSRVVLLVISSNRGLCGSYNSNIMQLALAEWEKIKKQKKEVYLMISGKKAIQAFKFRNRPVDLAFTHIDDKVSYDEIETLADKYMDMFTQGEIGAVRVVYTHFVSTSVQQARAIDLLPLESSRTESTPEGVKRPLEDYIFSPDPEEILKRLLPSLVRGKLFQCFIEAAAGEQITRMTAMKAATDNAQKMIKQLSQQYNRARQTNITGELLDILGGAEALK